VKIQLRDALNALDPAQAPSASTQWTISTFIFFDRSSVGFRDYTFEFPFTMSDEAKGAYFSLAPLCACVMSFTSLVISLRQR
jgi:hypothetical protein